VIRTRRFGSDRFRAEMVVISGAFFFLFTCVSYAKWANFEYRTFDLAFYTQAVWQFIHGRYYVSVLNTSLLGNHVEPIVFLFAPFLAVFRHPMIFVVLQNAALASMGPIGFDISRRLGFGARESLLLATALLIAPATGYIALHEFHPEALVAPFLLLLFRARLIGSLVQHWLWLTVVLACKENMALLVAMYCTVYFVIERKRGMKELMAWYGCAFGLALIWFLLCMKLISPSLNSGNIDYLGLYAPIGGSVGDVMVKAISKPQLIIRVLAGALKSGNLLWGLLLPFLCLPICRPRWLLISSPVLLQHLLSWRSSEWTIYFHYAAPLLPLFWIATVEAVSAAKRWMLIRVERALPLLLVIGCVMGQIWGGPVPTIVATATDWFSGAADRALKKAFLARIPADASVVAPLPYLSHLAMREKLYSLHFIMKGLKTLSRSSFEPPPPTEFVFVDYGDSTTFDSGSGYYHPVMKMADGRIVPSSDQLLHDFLKQRFWRADSVNQLTLFSQRGQAAAQPSLPIVAGYVADLGSGTILMAVSKSAETMGKQAPLQIKMTWMLQGGRNIFPWALLRLSQSESRGGTVVIKGLCGVEINAGSHVEDWQITPVDGLAEGNYKAELVFLDNSKRTWLVATEHDDLRPAILSQPIPLGTIQISRSKSH
jgi:uncharacterized membrane protein